MGRMRRRAPYRRVVADKCDRDGIPYAPITGGRFGMVGALHPERRRSRPRFHGDVARREPMAGAVGRRFARPTKGGSDATHSEHGGTGEGDRRPSRHPQSGSEAVPADRNRRPNPPHPQIRPSGHHPPPPPAVRASELRGRPPQGMAARGRETGGSGPPDESFGGSRAPGRHRPHTTPVQAGERRVGPDTARRHHTVTNGGSHEAPLPRPLADHPIFNRSARFDRNRKTVPADGSSRKVPPACATGPSCRRPRSAGFAATAVRVRSDGGIVPPRPARKRSPRGAPRRRRGVGPDHTLPAARSPPPGARAACGASPTPPSAAGGVGGRPGPDGAGTSIGPGGRGASWQHRMPSPPFPAPRRRSVPSGRRAADRHIPAAFQRCRKPRSGPPS